MSTLVIDNSNGYTADAKTIKVDGGKLTFLYRDDIINNDYVDDILIMSERGEVVLFNIALTDSKEGTKEEIDRCDMLISALKYIKKHWLEK